MLWRNADLRFTLTAIIIIGFCAFMMIYSIIHENQFAENCIKKGGELFPTWTLGDFCSK